MSFTFTQAQIDEIERIRNLGNDPDGTRQMLYGYIFDQISDIVPFEGQFIRTPKSDLSDADRSTWLWLRGALGANGNDGSFTSEFIRDYTGKPCERHAV